MTILATALALALLVCCLVAAALAGLVAVQHRAAAASDLAALAGAGSPERGCEVASRVASDNGAEVVECEVVGPVITLTVRIAATAPLGLRPTITSRARAGPAELASA